MDASMRIVYAEDETGMITAHIPEVPGAVSFGTTREEAKEMVLDALQELLAYRASKSQGQPTGHQQSCL
ncbi:MAG TPA: type II toxin-antitoxin system HicB family antitoxin [Fimbriimonas sp.]|nr:type II toxin-antitoxin system HicB family antitoxin [Fimbriimonas sp.]